MDGLTTLLILLNIMLATAFVVAKLAQLDQRHARRLHEEEEMKARLRDKRRR